MKTLRLLREGAIYYIFSEINRRATDIGSAEIKAMLLIFINKESRHERRGIEAFSLKAYRMWGNKSPAPPVLRPKGQGVKSHSKGAVASHVSAWIEKNNEAIKDYPRNAGSRIKVL